MKKYSCDSGYLICIRAVASGGLRGAQAPLFLADQLTLSQPEEAYSPNPVLRAALNFQTLQRPCVLMFYNLLAKKEFSFNLRTRITRGEYNVENLKLSRRCHKSCKTQPEGKNLSFIFQ